MRAVRVLGTSIIMIIDGDNLFKYLKQISVSSSGSQNSIDVKALLLSLSVSTFCLSFLACCCLVKNSAPPPLGYLVSTVYSILQYSAVIQHYNISYN